MSDYGNDILHVQTPTPLDSLAKWAQVNQANQQTGLLGQQTIGAGIDNQTKAFMLGVRGHIAALAGAPQGIPGAPGMPGAPLGGAGPESALLPGGAPGGGGAAQPVPTGWQTPNGTLPIPPPATPFGATMTPFGFPLPQGLALSASIAADPIKALSEGFNTVRQRISQTLTEAGYSANDPASAARVQNAARYLYTNGMIMQDGYLQLMQHPERSQKFIDATASPDAAMSQFTALTGQALSKDENGNVVPNPTVIGTKAAVAGAEARAKASFAPLQEIKVPAIDPASGKPILGADGQPMMETRYVHPGLDTPAGPAAAAGGGGAAGGGPAVPPGITPTKVFNALVGTEASGPNSVSPRGASGKAQIIQSTFDQYKLPGESYANEDDRVAAARRYVDDMWKKYPGDAARVAVGYFSGMNNIAPAGSPTPWIKDTNDGNMPVSQYVNRFAGNAGIPTQVAANTAGVTPTATDAGGAAPAAVAGAPAPAVGGIQGGAALSEPQKIAAETQKEQSVAGTKANIEQVTNYQNAALDKSQIAQRMNALIDQGRIESQSWQQGSFADHRMAALKWLDGWRQSVNQLAGKDILGAPDQSIGDWEAFNKNMLANVSQVVREVSPRAAVQEFVTLQKMQPQDTTTPQGMRQLFDEMQGVNDWLQAKSSASSRLDKITGRVNEFDDNWNKSVTPMAFIVHRMSTPDFRNLAVKLQASPEGRKMLQNLQQQMDFVDKQGLFENVPEGIPVGKQ